MYFGKIKGLNDYADIGTDSTAIDGVGAIINGSGEAKPNAWKKRITWTNKVNNKLK